MNGRITKRTLAASIFVLFAMALLPAQENIPGQKALLLLQDGLHLTPGTWTSYAILDKAKDETYTMTIASLTKETIQGEPYSRLEIGVAMKDSPPVVTSILAEAVGEFKSARIIRKLENRKVTLAGKPIDVLAVEEENDKGEEVTAQVSLQILPIVIYEADTVDIKMTALDFGGGAVTKIEGAPLPFALWLIETVANSLTKKK